MLSIDCKDCAFIWFELEPLRAIKYRPVLNMLNPMKLNPVSLIENRRISPEPERLTQPLIALIVFESLKGLPVGNSILSVPSKDAAFPNCPVV